MAELTFRILSGADRGRVHVRQTPITIGRESGNTIQVNDLLVSRCHLKIQEDGGVVLLADCESTNGTRVNGEPVRQWILRPGDLITLGGSSILVGTRAEIETRFADDSCDTGKLPTVSSDAGVEHDTPVHCSMRRFRKEWGVSSLPGGSDGLPTGNRDGTEPLAGLSDDAFFTGFLTNQPSYRVLFQNRVPPLPEQLSPRQTAELCELLQYLYLRLRTFQENAVRDRAVGHEGNLPGEASEGGEAGGEALSSIPLERRRCRSASDGELLSEDGEVDRNDSSRIAVSSHSPEGEKRHREPQHLRRWQKVLDLESLLAGWLRELEQRGE